MELRGSHVSTVGATDVKHGLSELAEGAPFAGLHQDVKDVVACHCGLLDALEGLLALVGRHGVQLSQIVELLLFFTFCGADDFAGHQGGRTLLAKEGVDPDDGKLSSVFEHFVMQTLLLDPRPLVHRLHGPQNSSALGDAIELT